MIGVSQGKQAALDFMQHLLTAPGTPMFQIGEMFAADKTGWRVYIRVGEKAITLDPKEARRWAEFFEREAGKPEWASQRNWALDNAKVLRESAQVVHRKNRDKIVPDGYADAMPTAGRA